MISFTDPLGLAKIGQRPIEEKLLGGGGGGGGSSIGGSSGGSGSLGGAGARAAGAAAGLGAAAAIDAICRPDGKWMCEGPGQYDKVGTQKELERMGWFTAYGNTEADATYNWKKLVQASAPLGYNARHIRPKSCKKIK